jgi:hypothetical protein
VRIPVSPEFFTARKMPSIRFKQHDNKDNNNRTDKTAKRYELVNSSLDKNDPAIMKIARSINTTSANFMDVRKLIIYLIALFFILN